MRQSRRAATPDARCVMDGATRRRAFPLCHGTTTRFLCAGSRRQRRAPPRTPGIPPHPRHHGRFIAARFRRATGRRHVSFAPVRTKRRDATCDARPTAGRQHDRPHACARHPGDMNVAPTCIPRLSHATPRAAGISPPPPGRHECRPYVYPYIYPTFITRHQPARPATGVIIYMCPYDYEGGPCIPVLPRKKKKTGGNAFFFNFYS